jgi:hypothetical protein
MERYLRWRNAYPGQWLAAALVADVATLMTDARTSSVLPWLLVDVWLTYRIWRGGPVALLWFRVLQTLGACLFGIVLAMSLVTGEAGRNAHPELVALYAISAWCLMAPALLRHAHRRRDRRLRRQLEPALSPD